MKVFVTQQDIQRAASRAHSIVRGGGPYEFEEYVLIEASEKLLSLRTACSNMEIIAVCPAEVKEPGAALVNSDNFQRIMSRLDADVDVMLRTGVGELDEDSESTSEGPGLVDQDTGEAGEPARQLFVKAGRSDYKFPVRDPDAFPPPIEGGFAQFIKVRGGDLMKLITKTRHAVSQTEHRYYLVGLYFHVFSGSDGPRIATVATDGYRLARASVSAPDGNPDEKGVILSPASYSALLTSVDAEEDVEIGLHENRARFTTRNFTLIAPVIEGKYPEYQRVIPTETNIAIDLHVGSFCKSLNRVASVTARDSDLLLTLNAGPDAVDLQVNTLNGHGHDVAEDCSTQTPIEISVYLRHLKECLDQIEGDRVIMGGTDNRSAFLIHEQIQNLETEFVIMPHRG